MVKDFMQLLSEISDGPSELHKLNNAMDTGMWTHTRRQRGYEKIQSGYPAVSASTFSYTMHPRHGIQRRMDQKNYFDRKYALLLIVQHL